MKATPRAALLALLGSLTGCGVAGTMNVEPVAISTQKPGNVAAYVAVSKQGAGVMGLDQHNFKVFENGVALDNAQIHLTLLPTSSAASHHAALLVDMSKALTADQRNEFSASLRGFIGELRQRQAVSLYAFDGSPKVRLVAEYARDTRAEPDDKDVNLDRLLTFARKDSSSSLYSAVMDGAQKLDATLAREGRPIHAGTVIVIAQNPDFAGRVEESKLKDFVQASPHQYFLLTIGQWATKNNVAFLGKSGTTRAASVSTLGSPLDALASAVADDYFKDYLVSYCSPSRSGKRELRLEVTTTDDAGKKSVGSYSTEFDASGFGPGCSPLALPRFVAPKTDDTVRVAEKSRATSNPAPSKGLSPKKPDTGGADGVKVSSAAPPSAPAIAEPPSGLGYE